MTNPPPFAFSLNGTVYEHPTSSITGAQIRAYAPDVDPASTLYLEGSGNQPDRQIPDHESLTIAGHNRLARFFTVPPANFGAQ